MRQFLNFNLHFVRKVSQNINKIATEVFLFFLNYIFLKLKFTDYNKKERIHLL